MSTTQDRGQALRREMLLQQAIDRRQDELVALAAETVTLLENNRAMETSQLRNLLNVSLETTSTEVVVSFICYQIARNANAWGKAQDGFGHTIITKLHKELPTKEVFTEVAEKLEKQELSDDERKNLEITARQLLVQRFLGYVHRWFYFLNKSKNEEKAEAVKVMKDSIKAVKQTMGGATQ
jgi:hypothetical protein